MVELVVLHANATGAMKNVETGLDHIKPTRMKSCLISTTGASRIEVYDGLDDTGDLKLVSEHSGRNTDQRPELNPDHGIFRVAPYVKIVSGAAHVFIYA